MKKNQCKNFLVIFLKSIFLKIFLKFKNWNKKINVNIFGNYIFKNAKNILKILQTEVKTIVCSSLMLILYSPYSVHGPNSDSLDYFIHWYVLFFDCPACDNGMVIKTYIPHQLSDVVRLNICGVTFKNYWVLKTGFIKTNGKTC